MIRNIQDIAKHLGADLGDSDDQTLRSIKRRVYKDTSCGASCDFGLGEVGLRVVTYSVRCALSILGWKVLGWRKLGGRTVPGTEPLPSSLADYLWTDAHRAGRAPVICKRDYEGNPLHEFGREWMDSLEIDDTLLKRTKWARGVVLTIRLTEKIIGPRFVVSGYAEGSDAELPSHEVALPCTGQDIDHAIECADLDGCQEWDQTNL